MAVDGVDRTPLRGRGPGALPCDRAGLETDLRQMIRVQDAECGYQRPRTGPTPFEAGQSLEKLARKHGTSVPAKIGHCIARGFRTLEAGQVEARRQAIGNWSWLCEELIQTTLNVSNQGQHLAAVDRRIVEAVRAVTMGQGAAATDIDNRAGSADFAEARPGEQTSVNGDGFRRRD